MSSSSSNITSSISNTIISCPICQKPVREQHINSHLDSNCATFIVAGPDADANGNGGKGAGGTDGTDRADGEINTTPAATQQTGSDSNATAATNPQTVSTSSLSLPIPLQPGSSPVSHNNHSLPLPHVSSSQDGMASIFKPAAARKVASPTAATTTTSGLKSPLQHTARTITDNTTRNVPEVTNSLTPSNKRALDQSDMKQEQDEVFVAAAAHLRSPAEPTAKRARGQAALQDAAPLAERMRPRSLDDIYGQDLVGPSGVLRGLIEQNRVPSMVLWGGPGTGKTTIARLVAHIVGARFVEINSTSAGVGDCKKIFADSRNELSLTGRKTILFCDEIHRFNKSQQDVFLGPVESGQITLIGATTENPSFKVQNALLSRCRTFTLQKLTKEDIVAILNKAMQKEGPSYNPGPLVDQHLITYLASFADGDARTALNLLELAMSLSSRPDMTIEQLKSALTKTLVYDRSGDQHYDNISALHKSVRGSDPDAAVYYLARMLQSGEDAIFIARRMVVMASEDVGLADNSMLSLATATYTACEKIGMPECRINLAHCAVALALAPKSTRSYRAYGNAIAKMKEPGVAGLPIPIHLRNAPTRLMKELGYGKEYKYNPNYVDGLVKQEYLPDAIQGSKFLEDLDLGTQIDPDLELEAEIKNEDEDENVFSDHSGVDIM